MSTIRAEQQFEQWMESQGLEWEAQPGPFVIGFGVQYTPDYYVKSQNCYYEVVGSRQAFHNNRAKYEIFAAWLSGVSTFKIVRPDGQLYTWSGKTRRYNGRGIATKQKSQKLRLLDVCGGVPPMEMKATVIRALRRACKDSESQRAWAASHGISQAYVNDVLKGRRGPGEKILAALGFRRVIVYEPQDEGEGGQD